MLLMLAGLISFIETCQVKYLNNVIEQDHRFIKKITNPMMGFKAFHSARATIEGIETAHMIRKKQLSENINTAWPL
jgi:putative transposase